jgi:hypothetical protein
MANSEAIGPKWNIKESTAKPPRAAIPQNRRRIAEEYLMGFTNFQ